MHAVVVYSVISMCMLKGIYTYLYSVIIVLVYIFIYFIYICDTVYTHISCILYVLCILYNICMCIESMNFYSIKLVTATYLQHDFSPCLYFLLGLWKLSI